MKTPEKVMLILVWLVTAATVAGQSLPSPDGVCKQGWQCKRERHCNPYIDQKERLKSLEEAYQLEGDEDIGVEQQKLAERAGYANYEEYKKGLGIGSMGSGGSIKPVMYQLKIQITK